MKKLLIFAFIVFLVEGLNFVLGQTLEPIVSTNLVLESINTSTIVSRGYEATVDYFRPLSLVLYFLIGFLMFKNYFKSNE